MRASASASSQPVEGRVLQERLKRFGSLVQPSETRPETDEQVVETAGMRLRWPPSPAQGQ